MTRAALNLLAFQIGWLACVIGAARGHPTLGALVAGVGAARVGLIVPALRALFDYAWFVGFGVGFAVYAVAMAGIRRLELADLAAGDPVAHAIEGGT